MKDAIGQELHEGDTVLIHLSNPQLRAKLIKVADGGLALPINPTQKAVTADGIEFWFHSGLQLLDAAPGQPHPTVVRIPDPGTEHIVKKGN